MKVAILAGGAGTRLAEETDVRPKPMVEIGSHPILWHIMKHYAHYGMNEFFIALGYKGELIKQYFLDYTRLNANMTVRLADGSVSVSEQECEDWTVHLIDTGLDSQTGGRLKRLEAWLAGETFMLTYGDGVSSVDLADLLAFHRAHGKLVTVTAVRPPARFGGLRMESGRVVNFTEKGHTDEGWINGGFMVLEPGIFGHLDGDSSSLEWDALEPLADAGQVMGYRHEAFWQCMDTLRDVRTLRQMWESEPPWKLWR